MTKANTHKHAQKFEWKTRWKISFNFIWLLCGKKILEHGAGTEEGQQLQQKEKGDYATLKREMILTVVSRTERKYCLISTSYLAGLFDIFILLHNYFTDVIMFWWLFVNEDTLLCLSWGSWISLAFNPEHIWVLIAFFSYGKPNA